MKCPHCMVDFHDNEVLTQLGNDVSAQWEIQKVSCSSCHKAIYYLRSYKNEHQQVTGAGGRITQVPVKTILTTQLIYPKGSNRPPVPAEVPKQFSDDYLEACLVLADSPKASAALSRRCLQNIIRDKMGIKERDLSQEIQVVIDKGLLPTDLLESIDSIRNLGNFAAHPIKSQSTGEIVEVEPGEADWNLDVLEMMFDYLFVRPAAIKKRRDALDAKLADAGKPPMK